MYDRDCKISHAHSKIGGLASWLNCGGGGEAGGGGDDSKSDEDDDPTGPLAKVVEHDGNYGKGGYNNDAYDEGEDGHPASTTNNNNVAMAIGAAAVTPPPPSSRGGSPHPRQHSHHRHEAIRHPSCGFAEPSSPHPG